MEIREFYDCIGQDYDVVLNRMMGKESFAAMLLQAFPRDKTMSALETAIEQGSVEEIFDQAHTFKGVAANLGFKPLFEKLVVLVELARQGAAEGVREAFEEVKTAYEQIIGLLKNVNF